MLGVVVRLVVVACSSVSHICDSNTVPIVSATRLRSQLLLCQCTGPVTGCVIALLGDLELLSHHVDPSLAGQQPAASSKAVRIRHVDSFSDSDEVYDG
jgi:hypothetical protein